MYASVEEIARIRCRWPKVRILLRGDSGFAREELMAWCEANRKIVQAEKQIPTAKPPDALRVLDAVAFMRRREAESALVAGREHLRLGGLWDTIFANEAQTKGKSQGKIWTPGGPSRNQNVRRPHEIGTYRIADKRDELAPLQLIELH